MKFTLIPTWLQEFEMEATMGQEPTKEQLKEIIKDWVMTIPLDDNPSDEDYDEVTQSIWEAVYGKSNKR